MSSNLTAPTISSHTCEPSPTEAEGLDAGNALIAGYCNTGSVLLERINMAPYARPLSEHLRLPVFSGYTFGTWFQAGLAPRDFGRSGSGPRT